MRVLEGYLRTVWGAATPSKHGTVDYTVSHRLVSCSYHVPHTWQLAPVNLHLCVALCNKKMNHNSCHYICPTCGSCYSFGLDVMCTCTNLARSSHCSNKFSYPFKKLGKLPHSWTFRPWNILVLTELDFIIAYFTSNRLEQYWPLFIWGWQW